MSVTHAWGFPREMLCACPDAQIQLRPSSDPSTRGVMFIHCNACHSAQSLANHTEVVRAWKKAAEALKQRHEEAARKASEIAWKKGDKCKGPWCKGDRKKGTDVCPKHYCAGCCGWTQGCPPKGRGGAGHADTTGGLAPTPDSAPSGTEVPIVPAALPSVLPIATPFKNLPMAFGDIGLAMNTAQSKHIWNGLAAKAENDASARAAEFFLYVRDDDRCRRVRVNLPPSDKFSLLDLPLVLHHLGIDPKTHLGSAPMYVEWCDRQLNGRSRYWVSVAIDETTKVDSSRRYFVRLPGVTRCIDLLDYTGDDILFSIDYLAANPSPAGVRALVCQGGEHGSDDEESLESVFSTPSKRPLAVEPASRSSATADVQVFSPSPKRIKYIGGVSDHVPLRGDVRIWEPKDHPFELLVKAAKLFKTLCAQENPKCKTPGKDVMTEYFPAIVEHTTVMGNTRKRFTSDMDKLYKGASLWDRYLAMEHDESVWGSFGKEVAEMKKKAEVKGQSGGTPAGAAGGEGAEERADEQEMM